MEGLRNEHNLARSSAKTRSETQVLNKARNRRPCINVYLWPKRALAKELIARADMAESSKRIRTL